MPCLNHVGALLESFRFAPSIEDGVVLLIIVVLVGNRLVAWSAGVGRAVDTSMFLGTVASPETLNG
jgi:hypothetical protein